MESSVYSDWGPEKALMPISEGIRIESIDLYFAWCFEWKCTTSTPQDLFTAPTAPNLKRKKRALKKAMLPPRPPLPLLMLHWQQFQLLFLLIFLNWL